MKKAKISGLFLLYVLMITLLIASNDLVNYHFTIGNFPIYMSVFTYPFLFFVANIITKEYGEKETIKAVLATLIVQVVLFLIQGLIYGSINLTLIIASSLAFIVSQAVNLFIASSLDPTKPHIIEYKVFQYAFVILIDTILFLLWMKDFTDFRQLITIIALSYLVKMVVSVILVIFEDIYLLKENSKKKKKA